MADHITAEIITPKPATIAASDSDRGPAFAIVMVAIVLVISITLSLVAYFALQIQKKDDDDHPVTPTKPRRHDLALDADGGVLKEAVSTPRTVDDDMDDPPLDPSFTIDDTFSTGGESATGDHEIL